MTLSTHDTSVKASVLGDRQFLKMLKNEPQKTVAPVIPLEESEETETSEENLEIGEVPFHSSIERNEFMQPETLIQQHLTEIESKKKIFMEEMKELDEEMEAQHKLAQKIKYERLQKMRKVEITKLQKDEDFLLAANDHIFEWKIEKIEKQARERLMERHRKEQQIRKQEEKKRDLIIDELTRKERERMLRQLTKHLLKGIQKEKRLEARRNKTPEPKIATPKYQKMEQKIKKQEEEQQQQAKIQIIKRRQAQHIDMNSIRQHQKSIKEKLRKRAQSQKLIKVIQHPHNFSTIPLKNEQTAQQVTQKIKKQKEFCLKVELPKISLQKRQQRLMNIDKNENPMKYYILRERGLTDKDIFQNFKDFHPIANAKEDGKRYLNELRKERGSRDNSIKSLSLKISEKTTESQPEPPKYINYLPTLKIRKASQIQTILRRNMNKSEKISALLHKTEELQQQVQREVLKIVNHDYDYVKEMQIQSRVDDMFLKMLHAKIAAVKLIQ